jgi:hypothetical protein
MSIHMNKYALTLIPPYAHAYAKDWLVSMQNRNVEVL